MWRMQSGNRVLSAAEWECFCTGLGFVRDMIEEDLVCDTNDAETGVAVFDRLSPEQKLALLADVASALSDPAIPMPRHTAANEAAIAAVLRTFWQDLCLELDVELNSTSGDEPSREYRRMLRAIFADAPDADELPEITETNDDEWFPLFDAFENSILWDNDFAMADDLLDLPPEAMEASLQFLTIDREYFVTVPREPNEGELIAARQTLARMLGVAVIDDRGLYPFLDDLYHGLAIGPCSEAEIAEWQNHPWVQASGCTTPNWECSYERWMEEFSRVIPSEPFAIDPSSELPSKTLPDGITVAQFHGRWVVRDEHRDYWFGLLDNAWTDSPDEDEPALIFPTAADAMSAYLQADRMYAERAARRQTALKRLGRTDQD
jgi:hypothetical protein